MMRREIPFNGLIFTTRGMAIGLVWNKSNTVLCRLHVIDII